RHRDLLEHGDVAREVRRGGEEARWEAEGLGGRSQRGGERPPHRAQGEHGGDGEGGVFGEGGQVTGHRGSFRMDRGALATAGAQLTGRRRNDGRGGTGRR